MKLFFLEISFILFFHLKSEETILIVSKKIPQNHFFQHRLGMKMILLSLNLVRKIGVCITSEENGESKLTSEENLFNNLLH
jgi:hypothetical protein